MPPGADRHGPKGDVGAQEGGGNAVDAHAPAGVVPVHEDNMPVVAQHDLDADAIGPLFDDPRGSSERGGRRHRLPRGQHDLKARIE